MNERIKDFIKQLDLRDNDIDLERFAELVRQDEREACADLVFEMLQHKEFDQHWVALHKAHMAIRARSKHE